MKRTIQLYIIPTFLLLCLTSTLTGQVSINADSTAADSSALLDVKSVEKGFLMPRMTQNQRLAIPSPAKGLFLFQTDSTAGFRYNAGPDSLPQWECIIDSKKIQILEPRTPVDELDPDGDGSLTIAEPGSYYLRANLVVTRSSGDGIFIDSDNVSIDLNGFAILPGPQTTGDGISVLGAHNNITIKNGSISGFDDSGIDAIRANQAIFSNLLVNDNASDGINAGDNCLIINCTARQNGEDGISADNGSIIRNCTASSNGDNGIKANGECAIYKNTASHNGRDGIDALRGTRIEGCTVYGNAYHGIDFSTGSLCINNLAYRNGRHGIDAANNALVMNNVSNDNGVCIDNATCPTGGGTGINTDEGAGIRAVSNTILINNHCSGNYFGIVVTSTDASVIGNDVKNNSHAGILGTSSGCLYLTNTAQGNGFAQSPTVSNLSTYPMGEVVFRSNNNLSFGPIINVSNAGDISTVNDSDHPFANFVY
ncbi:MAG: right-handed parallel beta-helix repeat-containing protein [Bacteroidota bacterium]